MNKQEFLLALRGALADLSETDLRASLDYYAEIIDDRMEEGSPETEAVASLGPVMDVARQILLDMPLTKLVKARVKPKRRLRAWEIVLIAVGSPVWFPVLLALAVVGLALYVVLWSLVISICAVDVSLAACFAAGIGGGIVLFIVGNPLAALSLISVGLVSGGLAIFLFFGCSAAARGTVLLAGLLSRGVKKCFIRKENVG